MDSVCIYVPHELFTPAESSHFEGEDELCPLIVGSSEYTFVDKVSWQADITNTGDALLVSGTAHGVIRTACARCLSDVEFSLTGDIEGYFLLNGDEESLPDDMAADEFDVLADDHIIEMSVLIKAALLCEMPLAPLCSDDCKGLCPICGVNLNECSCSCDSGATDPDFDRAKNPFAALKNLDLDNN